jgi:Flp pilus assembly protein TadD
VSLEIDPNDPQIAYALVILYVQENDWSRARAAAERLATLSPGNPQAQDLLDRILKRSPRGAHARVFSKSGFMR